MCLSLLCALPRVWAACFPCLTDIARLPRLTACVDAKATSAFAVLNFCVSRRDTFVLTLITFTYLFIAGTSRSNARTYRFAATRKQQIDARARRQRQYRQDGYLERYNAGSRSALTR